MDIRVHRLELSPFALSEALEKVAPPRCEEGDTAARTVMSEAAAKAAAAATTSATAATSVAKTAATTAAERALKRRKEIHQKTIVHTLIRLLYKHVRGNKLSLKGKANMVAQQANTQTCSSLALTYGEVISTSFQQILLDCAAFAASSMSGGIDTSPQVPHVFYDLGSGAGKAVLIAALGPHSFTKCVGIELLPELSHAAIATHALLQEAIQKCSSSSSSSGGSSKSSSKTSAARDDDDDGNALLVATRTAFVAATAAAAAEVATMSESALANKVVQLMGHKKFKASLKVRAKSFHAFLIQQSDVFALSDEKDARVSLRIREEDDVEEGAAATEAEAEAEAAQDGEGEEAEVVVGEGEDEDEDRIEEEEEIEDVVSKLTCTLIENPASLQAILPLPDVVFETHDLFTREPPWYEEATCAFAASLLFSEEMMARLARQVCKMRRGSTFISLKPLPLGEKEEDEGEEKGEEVAASVVLVSESFYAMSWQKAKVFIYRIS